MLTFVDRVSWKGPFYGETDKIRALHRLLWRLLAVHLKPFHVDAEIRVMLKPEALFLDPSCRSQLCCQASVLGAPSEQEVLLFTFFGQKSFLPLVGCFLQVSRRCFQKRLYHHQHPASESRELASLQGSHSSHWKLKGSDITTKFSCSDPS